MIRLCQPDVVTISTEVDRVWLAIVFHQNGSDVIELEALFGALLIAQVYWILPFALAAARRASLKPTRCSLQSGNDGIEGTRAAM